MIVFDFLNFHRKSVIYLSLFSSKALVHSSKTIISGFLINALSNAILCICPPDKLKPRSPTSVFNPLGSFFMKLKAFDLLIIFLTSFLVAFAFVHKIFFNIEVLNNTISCDTYPIFFSIIF